MSVQTKSEIRSWLETIFAKENLSNIAVNILGNSEKGDGYLGDIVFVQCSATTSSSQQKNFELVLKCSKKSEALRENSPVKEAFHNEIYLYSVVLPHFQQYQREKNVKSVFESFPKFQGYFTNDTTEIIALENLKKKGYDLWDKSKPLTLKHLKMVAREYGKYHGISVAMQDQNPEEFNKLTGGLLDLLKKFLEKTNFLGIMKDNISEACNDVLPGKYDKEVVEKWRKFGDEQLEYIFGEMHNEKCLKVISHGDCWNNNFMWKHTESGGIIPEKVAIIDWQISYSTSPILDLSYFLITAISGEDLDKLNDILDIYHESFSQIVRELGSDPEKLYAKKEFLNDWSRFARYGFAMLSIIGKMGFCNAEDIPDIAKSAEDGKDLADGFRYAVNDIEGFRDRIGPIIKYAIERNLI